MLIFIVLVRIHGWILKLKRILHIIQTAEPWDLYSILGQSFSNSRFCSVKTWRCAHSYSNSGSYPSCLEVWFWLTIQNNGLRFTTYTFLSSSCTAWVLGVRSFVSWKFPRQFLAGFLWSYDLHVGSRRKTVHNGQWDSYIRLIPSHGGVVWTAPFRASGNAIKVKFSQHWRYVPMFYKHRTSAWYSTLLWSKRIGINGWAKISHNQNHLIVFKAGWELRTHRGIQISGKMTTKLWCEIHFAETRSYEWPWCSWLLYLVLLSRFIYLSVVV